MALDGLKMRLLGSVGLLKGKREVDEETVNAWIAEADVDGDGKINLKEFISMMTNDDLGV